MDKPGTIPVCTLFSTKSRHTVLKEDHKDGSLLMRCDDTAREAFLNAEKELQKLTSKD